MLMSSELKHEAARAVEADRLRWYIVRTVSGAEWQVYQGLLRRGVSSFFPHYVASVRRNEWFRAELKALFPGYILAGLETDQTSDDVKKVGGAMSVLKLGDKMIELTSEQVERMRQQSADELIASWGAKAKVIRVNVGDWVAVPEGKPFAGTPVEITAIDKRGQITASLGNLGVSKFWLSDLTEGPRRPLRAIPQQQS